MKAKKSPLSNREKRDEYLQKKYGVGIEYYESVLLAQNGACAICRIPPLPGKNLHLDHNHETGGARGLLCFKCNKLTLGRLERSYKNCPDIILGLFKYAMAHELRGGKLRANSECCYCGRIGKIVPQI